MSILETAKDAYELAKTSATLELREKINSLREQAVDLQEENLRLKEENVSLRNQVEVKGQLVYRNSFYYLSREEGEDGPFCQRCMDADGKPIRLQDRGDDYWVCRECRNAFKGPNYKPPQARREPAWGHNGWMRI